MTERARSAPVVPPRFGVPIESTLARREWLANQYDYDFGQERIFVQLVMAVLDEIPEGVEMLEVGAATGLMTGALLSRATSLTALEPSPGMLRRLVSSDVAADPRLGTMLGMAEDLAEDAVFDVAVVTFTPRRGIGLLHLLTTLASHVRQRVVMLLDDDGSLDWAYLARAASLQGFDVRVHLVSEVATSATDPRRAAVLVAEVAQFSGELEPEDTWEFETRTIDVPYPVPRGTATRLVRYFLTAGERALLIRVDARAAERLYGSLRTAVHRIGREEVTVRRSDEGIQIVRLPKTME